MDQDDAQIGRVLSRREVFAFFGAAGVTLIGGANPYILRSGPAGILSRPSCIVRPEQTEGPYFVDERLHRSDIRPDPATGATPEGARLDLAFQVFRVTRAECTPLPGAMVDVWQCDAAGVYSGVRDTNGRFDTVGQQFLRGHQVTSADGTASFLTIYPGWYQGRTVHIHFKVRTAAGAATTHDFTSQLYFDDALTDQVMERAPYARHGRREIRNTQDGIYRRGGDQLLLPVTPRGDDYAATFSIGLQLD